MYNVNMTDTDESPVPYSTCASLLLAAHQLLLEGHTHFATELLIKCEALIPRVADPQGFASLMNQADRLWKSKHIKSGLRPVGIKTGRWQQIDLPFGEN